MAKMSDNQSPKLTFLESAEPSTPASGLYFIYAKTDGKLYGKNDAGTEIEFGSAGAGISATIFDAQGDIIVASAADTAARLALGASGTVPTSNGTTLTYTAKLPSCKESVITADVTMATPNTWTNSGLSLSLETGTWLVSATLMIRITQAGTDFAGIRLIESGGSSTVYRNNGMNLLSNNGQEITFHVQARITLAGTTTVLVQGIAEVRTAVICADAADTTMTDNVISSMTAIAVTSV